MRFARYGDKKKGPIPKRKSWILVEWFIQEISSEAFLSSMNGKGAREEPNKLCSNYSKDWVPSSLKLA